MVHYRLFCIDPAGAFFRCDEIEAQDDDEAGRAALELKGEHAAELWTGARHVTSFKPAAPAAPGAAAATA